MSREKQPHLIEDEAKKFAAENKETTREELKNETSEKTDDFFSESNQKVDTELVKDYEQVQDYGPTVGTANIIDSKSNQPRQLEIRVDLDNTNNVKSLKYTLIAKDSGNLVGYTIVSTQHFGKMDETYDARGLHPDSYYDNPQSRNKDFVIVQQMENKDKHFESKPGVGTILHRIAVERSFQLGFEGRTALQVGGIGGTMEHVEGEATSAVFHRKFGFEGKDVLTPDKQYNFPTEASQENVHHAGEEFTQKIDNFIEQTTKNYRKQYGDAIPKDVIRATRMRMKASEELPYMTLPAEIIGREKERMNSEKYLQANFATTAKLLEKHGQLKTESHALAVLREKIAGNKVDEWDYHKVAELYEQYGNNDEAKQYYDKAYEAIKDRLDDPQYEKHWEGPYKFLDAKILIGVGQLEKAKPILINLLKDQDYKERAKKFVESHAIIL